MNKSIEDKIGSTIYARLHAVKMSDSDRRRALRALHDASLVVDALDWVVKKIEQLRERLFLKPSLKH